MLAPTSGDPALVFLAVPDQHLPELGRQIAGRIPTGAGSAFVHLSGALPLAVLDPIAAYGHPIGSFHPLQSFAAERSPDSFSGILVAVDATTPELNATLAGLARSLGGRPRRVKDPQRDLYHAAATIAASDLVGLAAQAARVLEAAGWTRDQALTDLLPLMCGVLANLAEIGLPGALTGPIRRGDPATVGAHLRALAAAPSRNANSDGRLPERVYRILGFAALELAIESGLEPRLANHIRKALTG